MSQASEALTLLQIIALALPAAAIFFQIFISLSKESPISPIPERLLTGIMTLSMILFILAAIFSIIIYGQNSSSSALVVSTILIVLGLFMVVVALGTVQLALRKQLDQWVESQFDIEKLASVRENREEQIGAIDRLLTVYDEIEEMGPDEKLTATQKYVLETSGDTLDIDAVSIADSTERMERSRKILLEGRAVYEEIEEDEEDILNEANETKKTVAEMTSITPSKGVYKNFTRRPIATAIEHPDILFTIGIVSSIGGLFPIVLLEHWGRFIPSIVGAILIAAYIFIPRHFRN